jgi:hypothetical protein
MGIRRQAGKADYGSGERMKTLNNIVDAVSTAGGGVVMLAMASLLLLCALMFASHFHFPADDVITIRTTFVGFSGALLLALKSEGKANGKQQQTISEEKKITVTGDDK